MVVSIDQTWDQFAGIFGDASTFGSGSRAGASSQDGSYSSHEHIIQGNTELAGTEQWRPQ